MRKKLLASAAIIVAATTAAAAQSPQQADKRRPPQASEQQMKQRDAYKSHSAQDRTKSTDKQTPPGKSQASDSKDDANKTTGANTADTKSSTDQNKAANTKDSDTASSDKKPATNTADDNRQRSDDSKGATRSTTDTNRTKADSNRTTDTNRNADNNRDADTQRRGNASANDTNRSDRTRVSINRDQETKITAAIRTANVRPVANVDFSVSVGTVVPSRVELHTLPADVVAIVPQYRGYRFFVVRDEIVIVEPSSKKIVTVISRSGHQASSSERRTKFTKEQRETIRKSRPRATTGTSRKTTTVTVGQRIPDTVELYEFDEDVVRVVPSVRTYRYIPSPSGVYVVDPAERTVIEEID